ncbi:MAG: YggT family protein [Proteobacteria bacterium]|nr:YggT family protein [Pseudomonadota bacterium]
MNDPILTVVQLISGVLTILTYAIIIQAVVSWIRPNPDNPFVRLLNKVTDPILRPLGRLIPPIAGLDFTPVIAIVVIQLIQNLLPKLLGAY